MTDRTSNDRIRRKQTAKLRKILVRLISILIFFSVILAWQSHILYELNSDVIALEAKYENIKLTNDDLEGKLIEASRVENIEKHALKLGMVKCDNKRAEYVSYEPGDVQSADAQKTNSWFSWFGGLFN